MDAVATVRRLYEQGALRWPRIALDFVVFEKYCSRVFDSQLPVDTTREASDLYLCCACMESNAEALRIIESEGLEVARAAIARVNRERDFVQEVLQEVWDRLLLGPDAKIRQYSGRGPLLGWIRVAATRAALDRVRSRGARAKREVELSEQLAAHAPNPESFLTQAHYGPAFQVAIKRAVAALSPRERNVLRMHVTGGCGIDEIGRAYNKHRATAARWLDAARVRIYDSVRAELCTPRSKLTESEFKSLAHLLKSQLELHLSEVIEAASHAEPPPANA